MKRNAGQSVLSIILAFGAFVGFVFVLGLFVRGCNLANTMIDDGARTVVKEFAPSAMLDKYEWFKDSAATLDARKADIEVYQKRADATKLAFGENASAWPRDVREQFAQSVAEVAGLKASFNSLAAEYNAQMVKFNWSAFERFGDAPKGARDSLPREYKPYIAN